MLSLFTLHSSLFPADIPSYVPWLLPMLVIGIVVQFFWQSFTSFFLFQISKKDRGSEAMERRMHEQMTAAVEDRHSLTTKLVDERFRSMTHELNNHVQSLVNTLDTIKSRMQDGDEHFDGLDEKAQRIELASLAKIDALKDYMRENLASKRDMESHQQSMASKLGHVDQAISRLGEDVAVLKAQGTKRGGTQ